MSRPPAFPARARAVRLLLPVAAAGFALLLPACSVGQVAQTARLVPAVEGANVTSGGLSIADARIETPPTGAYRVGEDALLYLSIVTEDSTSDTLVRISTDAADQVVLIRPGVTTSGVGGSPSPSGSPSPTASAAAQGDLNLQLTPSSRLASKEGEPLLELRGLRRKLSAAATVSMTFSFAQAGDVRLDVPVATPSTPLPRESPDHPVEGA